VPIHELPAAIYDAGGQPPTSPTPGPRNPLDLPRWVFWISLGEAHAAACISWCVGMPLPLAILVGLLIAMAPTALIGMNIVVAYGATGIGEWLQQWLNGSRASTGRISSAGEAAAEPIVSSSPPAVMRVVSADPESPQLPFHAAEATDAVMARD